MLYVRVLLLVGILKIIYWRNLVWFTNNLEREISTFFISCFKLTPPFLMSLVLSPQLMTIIFSLRYHHTINMYPFYWLCIHFIGYVSILLAMHPFITHVSIREILQLFIVSMTNLTLYMFKKLSKFLGSLRRKLK